MSPQKPRQDQDDEATRIAPKTVASKTTTSQTRQKEQRFFAKNFQIEGIVGEGGVGRVYLAYDKIIGRRVAVKEILDYSPGKNKELINTLIC